MGALVSLIFLIFIIALLILGATLFIIGLLLIFSRIKKSSNYTKKLVFAVIMLVLGTIMMIPFIYIHISNISHEIKYQHSIRDTGTIIEIDNYNAAMLKFNEKNYVLLEDYLYNVKNLNPISDIDKKAVANIHIIEKSENKKHNNKSKFFHFFFRKENDIYKLYLLDANNSNLLYSELGGIWCSEEYLHQAILYYDDIDNYRYFYINIEGSKVKSVSINNTTFNQISSIINKTNVMDKEDVYVSQETFFVDIYAQSKNGLLQFEFVNDLLVKDTNIFYTTDRFVRDDGEIYYSAFELPIEYKP